MLHSSRITQVITFLMVIGLSAISLTVLATQVSAQAPSSVSPQAMIQPLENYSPATAIYVPHGQEQPIPANAALWYRFDYAGDRTPVLVKLAGGNRRGLDFKVVTPEQANNFETEGRYIGRGTAPFIACGVTKCESSDLIWQGGFITAGTYYIRVRNYTAQAQIIQLDIEGSGMSLGAQMAPAAQATISPQPTQTVKPTVVPTAVTTIATATPTVKPTAVPTAVTTIATATPTVAPTVAPTLVAANTGNQLSFNSLGFTEKSLDGPYDSTDIVFSLPADWQIDEGAMVVLTINAVSNGSGSMASPSPVSRTGVGGVLEVTFNDILQTTIQLDRVGEQTFTIPLRKDSLTPVRRAGRHDLRLFLDSAVDCMFDWHTKVVVRPSSYFVFPRHAVPMPTDLRLLPAPIYQQLFTTETTTIVVPDQPTPSELDAALSVAAGFGQMTNGKLGISLLPVAQLTSQLQSANHLIFVGRAAAFPMLKQSQLPAPASDSGFSLPGLKPDSGIIEMAVSPWNSSRVVLVVSGDSDLGMHKAGQAVSSGTIKVSNQPNLAFVSDVRTDLVADSTSTDRTFENLGYSNVTLQGFGTNWADYRFYVPSSQVVSADAYLNLNFNHSTLLEYDRSGGAVYLNDDPIGSIRFSDETAKQGLVRIAIPRNAVHYGTNRLTIQVDLVPRSVCVDPRLTFLWTTLRSDSMLHLPLAPTTEKDNRRVLDLATYPGPFVQDPTLSNVAFVLPSQDPSAWNLAARLAFNLGNVAKPALADLSVAFADNVPDNLRNTHDLLIVGRPSTLPILAQMKDALPAYFEPGSDLAIEQTVRVVYQIPEKTDVGYLEMIAAPWNSSRLVLNVLGSSNLGLQWAGDALTISRLHGKLGGDYAFINGEQIVNGDARMGVHSVSLIPTVVPMATAVPVNIPNATPITVVDRPAWVLPAIGGAISLMVLILAVVLISSLRRPKPEH